jgi:pimeloyl-ACP methyl ester carboxylesterase
MPFVSSGDDEIYYQIWGQGNTVIVFVSGYMGIADMWVPLAARLSDQYCCIAYDNRGFGRSSKSGKLSDYGAETNAQDIKSLLIALRIDQPVILVTHSFGCFIASSFYLQHPHRVAGIVYTGATIDGLGNGDSEAVIRAFTQDSHIPSKAVQFYTNFGLSKDIACEAAKWSPEARKNSARQMVNFKMGDRWSEVIVPTMVIQGENDIGTPPETSARPLAAALPTSRIHILEGVNHFPPTEAPEVLAKLIDGFVASFSS